MQQCRTNRLRSLLSEERILSPSSSNRAQRKVAVRRLRQHFKSNAERRDIIFPLLPPVAPSPRRLSPSASTRRLPSRPSPRPTRGRVIYSPTIPTSGTMKPYQELFDPSHSSTQDSRRQGERQPYAPHPSDPILSPIIEPDDNDAEDEESDQEVVFNPPPEPVSNPVIPPENLEHERPDVAPQVPAVIPRPIQESRYPLIEDVGTDNDAPLVVVTRADVHTAPRSAASMEPPRQLIPESRPHRNCRHDLTDDSDEDFDRMGCRRRVTPSRRARNVQTPRPERYTPIDMDIEPARERDRRATVRIPHREVRYVAPPRNEEIRIVSDHEQCGQLTQDDVSADEERRRPPSRQRGRVVSRQPVRDTEVSDSLRVLTELLVHYREDASRQREDISQVVNQTRIQQGRSQADRFLQVAFNQKLHFSGSTDHVRGFLKDVERLRTRFPVTDNELLDIIPHILKNPALRYFEEHRALFTSWRTFQAHFKSHYLEEGHETRLLTSLFTRKQGLKESPEDFVSSLLSMNRDLENPISEARLVEVLRANLNPDYLRSFHMHGAPTLENFEAEAKRVAAALHYEAQYQAPPVEVLRDPFYGNPSAPDVRVARKPQVLQAEIVEEVSSRPVPSSSKVVNHVKVEPVPPADNRFPRPFQNQSNWDRPRDYRQTQNSSNQQKYQNSSNQQKYQNSSNQQNYNNSSSQYYKTSSSRRIPQEELFCYRCGKPGVISTRCDCPPGPCRFIPEHVRRKFNENPRPDYDRRRNQSNGYGRPPPRQNQTNNQESQESHTSNSGPSVNNNQEPKQEAKPDNSENLATVESILSLTQVMKQLVEQNTHFLQQKN